ncbi:MAG: S8/S53 family peptidase [Candidatus Eremiobacteraeota bacterium]|nr:S8/S53 family peptidase [Candidatus Eremiobacteraeota bacterium]
MAQRWVVPGSERAHLPGTRVLGDADPSESASVTLILRSKAPQPPTEVGLSRQAFADRYGADGADVSKVAAFAREHGLRVVESSIGRRSVTLEGSVAQLNVAFGVSLKRCQAGDVIYRGREGGITLPSDLSGVVEAVLGLDDRPQAAPRVRIAAQAAVSFTPPQIAQLYDFPGGLDGSGQCVGIIELGGGFSQSDFATYLSGLGIAAQTVTVVSVDGASNSPGQDQNADVEVMLDAEIVGAVAPGARIAIYFAPNTDQGFVDAVTTAIHDAKNAPSIVSISWGAAESNWTQQGRDALNGAIAAAEALAVTVCAASGDGGSSDGVSDGASHADFPASSPYVLGCGGTTLLASGGTIGSEVAWSDSGGGVSSIFALPSWQSGANVPAPPANTPGGRGVPDVSGDADPNSGYQLRVDGSALVAGGTSAVAPLWAALIALMNQKRGTNLGFLNAKIYALPGYPNNPGPLHDITSGSNGAYSAAAGWDPCTGLGTPDGGRLVQALLPLG